MQKGGVTYADTDILKNSEAYEVQEEKRTKFISGANLCINLKDPSRVFPFYNPPGARGEDTFLSTCLTDRKVLKVPCYAFHDGFSAYNCLMDGVLPISLKPVCADSEKIVTRFYKACIGWIRYKPLLLYITQRDAYEQKIQEMREKLNATIPKVCAYFDDVRFTRVLEEFERYNKNVLSHYGQYVEIRRIWSDICGYLEAEREKG
jgi:hypothetical protein